MNIWIEGGQIFAKVNFHPGFATKMGRFGRWNKRASRWSAPFSRRACREVMAISEEFFSRLEISQEVINGACDWSSSLAHKNAVHHGYQQVAHFDQPLFIKTPLWRHQLAAAEMFREMDCALLGMEMGTGKTLVALTLFEHWKGERILIACPRSAAGVWPREFERHACYDCNVVNLTGKKITVAKAAEMIEDSSRRTALVVNYDRIWREPLAKAIKEWAPQIVCCDEVQRIKTPGSNTSRFLQKLGDAAPYRLGMTGTPITQSPTDIYSIYRFLDPTIFGKSVVRFRSRYCIVDPSYPSIVREWINTDELREKMREVFFRVRSDDVLDLPPIVHQRRYVQISAKARRNHDEIQQEFLTVLGARSIDDAIESIIEGEESGASVLSVKNALTKVLRMLQICSGYVPDDEGGVHLVDGEKQAALKEIIEDRGESKIVVFCQFQTDLLQVRQVCEILQVRYGEVSGRRQDLTEHATMPSDVDVMGIQWRSGSAGIDCTAARIAVIFTPTYSVADTQQGIKRLHRPGQTRPVVIYEMCAEGCIDSRVYAAVKKHSKLAESIVDA